MGSGGGSRFEIVTEAAKYAVIAIRGTGRRPVCAQRRWWRGSNVVVMQKLTWPLGRGRHGWWCCMVGWCLSVQRPAVPWLAVTLLLSYVKLGTIFVLGPGFFEFFSPVSWSCSTLRDWVSLSLQFTTRATLDRTDTEWPKTFSPIIPKQ